MKSEIIPDSGVPIEPADLDQIISLRLPGEMAAALRDEANRRGVTVSDLLRNQIRRLVGNPIGWQCDHMSITSGGVLGQPSAGCGCEMQPVYRRRDLRTA